MVRHMLLSVVAWGSDLQLSSSVFQRPVLSQWLRNCTCWVTRADIDVLQTYKEAIVYPGPRLNLVLGPNGMPQARVSVECCNTGPTTKTPICR